jgi:uroporphyrinogen-III synthase
MNEKPTVLSTKILSEIQKQELINSNFEVLDFNFIEVINTALTNKNKFNDLKNNLIFTSQNAVLSVLESENIYLLKTKVVFCVGLKTKALLEENGFEVAVYVDYAEDLAEIISLIYKEESFTFFSGNLRKDLLPKTLKKAKIDFSEIEVYETKLSPKKIKDKVDAILYFSPSGVESFLKDNKITKEICFCIGNTTAEALQNITKNIVVAEYPSIEGVIEQCINEFA